MPVNPVTEFTSERKEKFLEVLSETCNVSRSAEAIGVSRQTIYQHVDKDPDFATAFEKARMLGAYSLEDEMVRRGKEGILKPIFYKGQEVGQVKEYSDTLLIVLAKGALPDKYKDRVEQEQKGAIEITIRDLRGEKTDKNSNTI